MARRSPLGPEDFTTPDYTGTAPVPYVYDPTNIVGDTAEANRNLAQLAIRNAASIPVPVSLGSPVGGGGGGMLEFSNGFVSTGDYSGSLPGSQGNANLIGDLVSVGGNLLNTYLQGRNQSQQLAGISTGNAPAGVATTGVDAILKKLFGTQLPLEKAIVSPGTGHLGLRARNRLRAQQGLPPLHPRMNVTNVHALRRAMRRVTGFSHLAKSTIAFTHSTHLKKKRRR